MREVKFRGKIVTTDSWVYGHYAFVDGYHVIYEDGKPLIIKLNTLGQYTGLKGKNGREIYEGDIYRAINRNFESEVRGKITYLHGCYMFGNWNAQEFFNKHQHIEVIGNIYQNPNLLEESQ